MPQLLYMDRQLLVISKPCNLPVEADQPEDTEAALDSVIQRLTPDFPGLCPVCAPGFASSGIMLLALDSVSQQALNQAYAAGEVQVSWQAMLSTPVETDTNPLPMSDGSTLQWHPVQAGAEAITTDLQGYRLRLESTTSDCQPLRQALHSAGFAVIGETAFGELSASTTDPDGAQRLLLHAQTLSFQHPTTGLAMNFSAPCPF